MKFNIADYIGKYAMHCKTKEEAEDFCNYLNRIGKTRMFGGEYDGLSLWNRYRDELTINFGSGTHSEIDFYRKNNFIILEWEDFMNKTFTKKDLKNWDIIQYRNGRAAIVNTDLKSLISDSGYNSLNIIKEDLTCGVGDHSFDIIAVRRPKIDAHCQLDSFEYSRGTLVYERKEVEEMTLEQVCKLLGKEIKIVK